MTRTLRALTLAGPALLTIALGLFVAARRPIWLDEGATVWTAALPWDDFIAYVTRERDAVHALYYLLVRGFGLFAGTDLLVWRLPSVVAMGLACLAVTLIGRALGSPRLGLLAGLAFALLPVVWDYGAEARAVALATASVTWASYLLIRLLREDRRRWWCWGLYVAMLTVGGYLFIYSWLVALAHLLTVLLSTDRRRGLVVPLLVAQAVSLALLAPLAALAVGQRGQVSWITTDTFLAIRAMAAYVLGERNPATYLAAVVMWAVVAWGTATIIRSTSPGDPGRRLLLLGWSWAAVPGLALGVVSLWTPTFSDRYITVSAPAVALLIGASLDAMRSRWLVVGATVVLAVSLVILVTTDWAAGRDQWRDKRAVLAAHAEPGDGVLASPRFYERVTRFETLPAGAAAAQAADSLPASAAWARNATVSLDSRPSTVWLVPFACPLDEDRDVLRSLGYRRSDEYPITYSDGRQCPVERWAQP